MRRSTFATVTVLAVAFPFGSELRAQEAPPAANLGDPSGAAGTAIPEAPEGAIQVRVIADRLMVRCDLASKAKRIGVHLLVEFDNPEEFELHGKAGSALELESGELVSARFPGFVLKDLPPRNAGNDRAKLYGDITKYFSTELGEVPCAGTIGYGALKKYRIVLDVGKGEMQLTPASARAPQEPADPETVSAPLNTEGGLNWFAVQVAEKTSGMFCLATSTYDTLLAKDLAQDSGHPAGDVGKVTVAGRDFSPFVAFRPAALSLSHSAGALGTTGLNLLKHFRVELDPVAKLVRFTRTAPAQFPEQDLEFFRAMVTEKAEPVEKYLEAHPKERTSAEAAMLLLARRVDSALDAPDAVKRAVRWVNDTTSEDLRTSRALDLMDYFQGLNLTDFQQYAGELGLEKGRVDRDALAVHKIHGRLGEILLEKGSLDEAWRHLLSAAFGLKEDGPVNYDLGLLYEKKGKLDRAFSRYVQAVITEDAAARAMKGLTRIQQAQGQGATMPIERIEHLIEGKVPAYRTASRFKATPSNSTNRVVLAELYTNPLVPPHIAAELAFDAAISYFPRENVAVIEHHVPLGGAAPLVSRVALESCDRVQGGPTLAVLDGRVKLGLAGREPHKEPRFEALKNAIFQALLIPSEYTLKLTAEVKTGADPKDAAVAGAVEIEGPARDKCALEIVLVEKGLLFPGKSFPDKQLIAVHHMVSRGSLLEGGRAVAFAPQDGRQKVSFSRTFASIAEELEGVLAQLEKDNGALFSLRPTRVDPRAIAVVAILRNTETGEVLQAAEVEPQPPAEEK
jgi:tetratricopeptide (TPR) repeat protein